MTWNSKRLAGIQDELFDASVKEARAGARLIVWAENSAPVLKQDEAGLIGEEQIVNRGKEFADKESVYLGMSLQVVHNPRVLLENRFVLITPSGQIGFDFFKAHPIFPSESSVTQNRSTRILLLATEYGNLGAVICHDMDFHLLLHQAGRTSVDIMLDPSADWKDIDPCILIWRVSGPSSRLCAGPAHVQRTISSRRLRGKYLSPAGLLC